MWLDFLRGNVTFRITKNAVCMNMIKVYLTTLDNNRRVRYFNFEVDGAIDLCN